MHDGEFTNISDEDYPKKSTLKNSPSKFIHICYMFDSQTVQLIPEICFFFINLCFDLIIKQPNWF